MNELIRQHLIRLATWSIACIFFSLIPIIFKKGGKGVLQSFLYMNAAWCLVNIIVVAFAWNAPTPQTAEFREFMKLMEGMNMGYMAVGIALAVPKLSSAKLCGAGWSVALQGAALYCFDKYLFAQVASLNN